jgi:hypothetical protein
MANFWTLSSFERLYKTTSQQSFFAYSIHREKIHREELSVTANSLPIFLRQCKTGVAVEASAKVEKLFIDVINNNQIDAKYLQMAF